MTRNSAVARVELLDIELVRPDRMPLVYPMPLMGRGSGEVECLTSYVQRLAAAHSLTTGVFLSKVIRPETQAIKGRLSVKAIHAANGLGKYANEITGALLALQRQDLCTGSTFLSLAPALDPIGHGLVTSHLKWCSQCWAEDTEDGYKPYVRLLWTAQIVFVCPRHKVKLQVLCPHCGKGQRVCSSFPAADLCQQCWKVLWESAPNRKQVGQSSSDFVSALNMLRLIARMPSLCAEALESAFSENIRRLSDELFDKSKCRLARCLGIDPAQIYSWSKIAHRPTFTSVVNVSKKIGVPFDQLLMDSDNLVFPDKLVPHAKVNRIKKTHISRKDFERQQRYLNRVVDEDRQPPPNLTDVAAELGCNYMTLSKRFPTQCSVVSDRASGYRAKMRRNGQLARLDRVVAAVRELLANGITPSDRHLKQLDYVRPSDIRDETVRVYLDRVRRLN